MSQELKKLYPQFDTLGCLAKVVEIPEQKMLIETGSMLPDLWIRRTKKPAEQKGT